MRLASEFHSPSRLGDELTIVLTVPQLGRSSMAIDYALTCGDQLRAEMRTVVVQVDLTDGRSRPIAGGLRERIERFRSSQIATS
ncbi:MAG TPA: hotdog domain-containing protein [Casimicrobiaceae bacterium]|nr:hotdog domain-containing protein [Casimicrobiaceae bacterium]